MCLSAMSLSAETPVQSLVSEYKDFKGVKDFIVGGNMMNMVRPMLRYYTIGPIASDVTGMSILNMSKSSIEVLSSFEDSLQKVLSSYHYAGKTQTPNGLVDTYVHFESSSTADELVIYNPKILALYSLVGQFKVVDLQRIEKKE